MRRKIFVIGFCLFLIFVSLLVLAIPTQAQTVTVEGHKQLTWFEKLLNYQYIMGGGNLQIGHKVTFSTSPPSMLNPTSTFTKGESIEVLVVVYNVKGGDQLMFNFCDVYGNCRDADIIYLNGRYYDWVDIGGDWDLYYVYTAFAANEVGSFKLTVRSMMPQGQYGVYFEKSYTVIAPTPTPQPTQTPMICTPYSKRCFGLGYDRI